MRDIAASDMVRLHLIDAQDAGPCEGVLAFDMQQGQVIATSDKNGEMSVERSRLPRVLLFAEGYLARQVAVVILPPQMEETVEIFRDRYSILLALKSVWPEGMELDEDAWMELIVTRIDGRADDGQSFPRARYGRDRHVPPKLQQAWQRHSLLMSLDISGLVSREHPQGWHLGREYRHKSLPVKGASLRFAEAGLFEIRAKHKGVWIAKAKVLLRPVARNEAELVFQRGSSVELHISDAERAAVKAARVYLSYPGTDFPRVLQQESDERGKVLFEGLFAEEKPVVHIEKTGFAPKELRLPSSDRVSGVRLVRLARIEIDVFVSEAGSDKALSGVRALLSSSRGGKTRVQGDRQGRLRLPVILGDSFVLTLRKDGYLRYKENLKFDSASEAPRRFSLVPSDVDRQRRLGLISVVFGRIALQQKQGRLLRLEPENQGFEPFVMPRRIRQILEGGSPPSLHRVLSDAKGEFKMFTTKRGACRVVLIDGATPVVKRLVLVPGELYRVDF